MRAFSATGSQRNSAKNAAQCDVLGSGRGFFSDIHDLLAEDAVRCEPFSG
jgi:hypothetical protein